MKDPIVEEVRKYRQEHVEKFGGDLNLVYEDIRCHQANSGHKIVRLQPKKLPREQTMQKF